MWGLYTLNAHGKPEAAGWRGWAFVLGAPLLVAVLLLVGWHLVTDHALLHQLAPAMNQSLQAHEKSVNERLEVLAKTASDSEPLKALAARVDELAKRTEGVENGVRDLLRGRQ